MKKLIVSTLLVLSVVVTMTIGVYAIDIDEPLTPIKTTSKGYNING